MNACVLDASVVAAALFHEEHAQRAGKLLSSGCALLAPDLIYAEFANVIWKRCGRGEIEETEAVELLADFRHLVLRVTPCGVLSTPALALAVRIHRSVYDCLYLALAIETKSVMVTADQRLIHALADTPLADRVAWIGALK